MPKRKSETSFVNQWDFSFRFLTACWQPAAYNFKFEDKIHLN